MACSRSGASNVLLCLGFFVIASSFCHCATLTRLKALDTFRESSLLSQSPAKRSGLLHGRLLIGQNPLQSAKLKGIQAEGTLLDVDSNYQADMGWEPNQPKGFSRLRSDTAVVEQLLKLEPRVECTQESMLLQLQDTVSTTGSLLFVDRGSRLSPLPLSRLPPSCGYTVRSTRKDLVLVAPYDACFVALEEDSYVLPLRWCGVPVRMSCPLRQSSLRLSSPNPPMVTCHTTGMVVKTEWVVSVANIKVNLSGNWEPLMEVSPSCGFSVVAHPEGVVISIRYEPCLEEEDGMYTVKLIGDGKTEVSCPTLLPTKPHQPDYPQAPVVPIEKPTQSYPKGQEYKPSQSGFYPQPPDSQTPQLEPLPEEPQGQMHYPLYPYPFPYYPPFMPQDPYQTPIQQVSTPAPEEEVPQPEAYVTESPRIPEPPLPEANQGQTYLYPYPFFPQHESQPDKPTQKPAVKLPDGLEHHPFNLYYYPQHVILHPSTIMQSSQVPAPASHQMAPGFAFPQPVNTGVITPGFHPGYPYMPPVYCPQFCPSGFSNCCPQIAFHQYLNVPFGLGGKDAYQHYPAPPFFPSVAHSGFPTGFVPAPFPQNSAEAVKTQTAASGPILLQQLLPGKHQQSYLQPPDGDLAALATANSSKHVHPKPVYPNFIPYFVDTNWPYFLSEEKQSSPQSQTSSRPQYEPYYIHTLKEQQGQLSPRGMNNPSGPGSRPQYEPYYIHTLKEQQGQLSPRGMNNPSGPDFMSYMSQDRQRQNKPAAKELQLPKKMARESTKLDQFQVPYYMSQDDQAPTYRPAVPKSAQPFVSGSKKNAKRDVPSYSEPGSYVLLQQGPPHRELGSLSEFPLNLVHDPNYLAQNHAKQHGKPQHHQNLKPLQEMPQTPKWLGKGMPSPLPGNANYMLKPEAESLPVFDLASDGPHFVPLDLPLSAEHSPPKSPESSEDKWKSLTSRLDGRIPPYVPGTASQ